MNKKPIFLVGLGNPLSKYAFTPHNLGFIFVDQFLTLNPDVNLLKMKEQVTYKMDNYTISKPTTYMNLSGKAVRELIKTSHLTPIEFVRSLLVVHDDISLPMHVIRMKDGKENPGLAGHNGLRSIVAELQHLGLKQSEAVSFHRLRLGCKVDGMSMDLASYVLAPMTKEVLVKWIEVINQFLNGKDSFF